MSFTRWAYAATLAAFSFAGRGALAQSAEQSSQANDLRVLREKGGYVFIGPGGNVEDSFARRRFPLAFRGAFVPESKPRDVKPKFPTDFFATLGKDRGGRIHREDFAGGALLYSFLDVDHRGYVTKSNIDEYRATGTYPNAQKKAARLIARYDTNKDGVLTIGELPTSTARRWFSCDVNHDGKLVRLEIAQCYADAAKKRRLNTLAASTATRIQRSAPPMASIMPIAPVVLPCAAAGLWAADYFAAASYVDIEKKAGLNPYAAECLPSMIRNYTTGSSPSGVASGNVVRFRGTIDLPKKGVYEFAYRFDGKAVIKVDQEWLPPLLGPKAEDVYSGATPKYSGQFNWSLEAGKRQVTIYYFDVATPGFASLSYKLVKELLPPPPKPCAPDQWTASFYNPTKGPLLDAKPAVVKCHNAVDFTWAPATSPAAGVKDFDWSVLWTRNVALKTGDKRQFELSAFPSGTIRVDGNSVIDPWSPTMTDFVYGSYTAKVDTTVKVEVQYSTHSGDWDSAPAWRIHAAMADCKNPMNNGCFKKDIVHIPQNKASRLLRSQPSIENINATVDVMNDGEKPSGKKIHPHKTDYTWRFYGGNSAVGIRFHFSKFKFAGEGNKLIISGAEGMGKQTLTGDGPPDGWTSSVFGDVAYIRLVTDSASQQHGFAIDSIEVSRVDQPDSSVLVLGEVNREWNGYLSGNGSTAYALTLGEGLHDFFVQAPGDASLDLCVREGLVEPKFASCIGDAVGPNASKVVSFNVPKPGYYTIAIRNKGTTIAPYTFMVNRVANVFDVEVEFDWTVPAEKMAAKKCQLEELFRRSSERFYGLTDGYMRFGKITYYMQSCYNNSVDVTFYENDAVPTTTLGVGTQDTDDVNMHQNQLRHYADGKSCANEGGDKSGQGASSFLAHEWGHYAFWLADEYYCDGSGGDHMQCPYSIMAGGWDDQYEYCTALTHLPTDGNCKSKLAQGDHSCWRDVAHQAGIPEQKLTPNPYDFEHSAIGETVVFDRRYECP